MRSGIAALAAVLLGLCAAQAKDSGTLGAPPAGLDGFLDRLRRAYPQTIRGRDGNALLLADGTRLTISDGNTRKTAAELIDHPDIDDMFAYPYPQGAPLVAPGAGRDPGRVRVEGLFRALYGDCRRGGVAPRMRRVAWVPRHGGGTVSITTAQGADKALERVSRELDALPPRFGRFLVPSAGTYNCRAIAGSKNMSMHGYGAAIDLNTEYSDYWRWSGREADGSLRWRNRMPKQIVEVFERNGFVWGGRWYHFDTMHFEYRPELAGSR